MCANDPNGAHLNDENTVRMADKVLHVDREDSRRSRKDRKHHPMTAAEQLDYSHPVRDFVFSTLCADFETKFSPYQFGAIEKKTIVIME